MSDYEVNIVPEIDTGGDAYGEWQALVLQLEVVQRLRKGEEEVADIMCNVYGDAHVCKMKTVAESDQGGGDDVVRDELTEVLAPLLEPQHHNDDLLGPEGGPDEVVGLKAGAPIPRACARGYSSACMQKSRVNLRATA